MGVIGRLLAAGLASCALTAVAAGAMYVTTAPRFVSLAIEPLSLLLLPGLVVALATAGGHDFSAAVVVRVSFVFYFVLLYAALAWRDRRGALARRGSR